MANLFDLPENWPGPLGEIGIGANAIFSDDKAYRFVLWRIWDVKKPPAMLIGLNPSTANEKTDDPTIRRIRGLMQAHGYGGFFMTNLYPFVTAYPQELQIGRGQLVENDVILCKVRYYCETVVFCWGNFKTYGRDREVTDIFPCAMCFGKNANGSPKHPLYLPKNTTLVPF